MMRYPSRQEVTERAVKNLSRVRHAFGCVGYSSQTTPDEEWLARPSQHSPEGGILLSGRITKSRINIGDFGGREGIRTLGLLVANEEKFKLRRGTTIT